MAKDKYTAREGDSLADLEVRLLDRDKLPMDLTNASEVRIYLRKSDGTANKYEGAMEAIPAQGTEEYSQRVRGPNVTTALDEVGTYFCYFKVQYPTKAKRVPSDDFFVIEVKENWE